MTCGRDKVVEWSRRYLPLEIAGWVGELGGAAAGYMWTGSLAAAALVATIGGLVAYYVPAYVNAVRWSLPHCWGVGGAAARHGRAHLLAIRSLAIEFGPAEAVDTFVVRPGLIYAGPILLDDVLWGWIVGGFVADVLFYVCTIVSYEKFNGLLAQRHPREAHDGEHEPTIATV